MKRLFMLGTLTLTMLSTFAQSDKARTINYTIKSGLTFSKFNYQNQSDGTTTKGNTGFYVSALANLPVKKMVTIQSGLTLIGKGNNAVLANTYIEYTDLLYLEIPVNLLAEFKTGPGKILVGAGPYLGIGIDGGILKKTYETTTTPSTSTSTDIRFNNSPGEYKTLDFGLNFSLGYRLDSGLGINAGYSLGMVDIYNSSTTNQSMRNSGFSAGLSFTF